VFKRVAVSVFPPDAERRAILPTTSSTLSGTERVASAARRVRFLFR
jgi:hypothetical protein